MMRRLVVSVVSLFALCTFAAEKSGAADATPAPAEKAAPAKPPEKKFEFERYSLVMLRRGAKWTPEATPQVQELQRQHIGHLEKMAKAGKLVVAGPVTDQEDITLRGLALYTVPIAEARALAEQDPMVKAGRLRVEVVTWMVEKGALAFPLAVSAEKSATQSK